MCEHAHFKSGECCLEGTRVNLIESVSAWTQDCNPTNGMHLQWVHGKAGSGKSTVANTLGKTVEQDFITHGFSLSCFFCRRDVADLSYPTRVLPTIAYRFAEQHESFRLAILDFFGAGTRGAGIVTTADIYTVIQVNYMVSHS